MSRRITFLQMRPADSVNEIWAATRRNEGTVAVELDSPTPDQIESLLRSNLIPISGDGAVAASAYAVEPANAGTLRKGGVAGWRITILDEGSEMDVLDVVTAGRHHQAGLIGHHVRLGRLGQHR